MKTTRTRIHRRKILAAGGAIALLAGACGAPSSNAGRPRPVPTDVDPKQDLPDPLPRVAATVNGSPIYTRHVQSIAETGLVDDEHALQHRPAAYRQALSQLIVRELLFQEALQRGIVVDRKIMEAAENEARAGYKSEEEFQKAIASQGLDAELFRVELRVQQTVSALFRQEADRVTEESVTDQEIQAYYAANAGQMVGPERIAVRQILIRIPRDAKPEVRAELRKRADKALREAREKPDGFAAVAARYSDEKLEEGTGREVFGRGAQNAPDREALETVAKAMKEGDVSDVVEGQEAFYIVKLERRIKGDQRPLHEMRDKIRTVVAQQKRGQAIQKLVDGLRARATIESYL
jgi:parvulin-like peptidyl-prolyl isomerase